MRSFNEWLLEERFYIKDNYDPVTDEGGQVGPLILFPWQSDITEHILTPDDDDMFPYTTIVWSCPKKNGKTTMAAAITGYFSEEYPGAQEIYMMANDFEQAVARSYKDLRFHFDQRNENLPDFEQIEHYKSYARLPSGTEIRPLAQDAASAAGSRHLLTVWDELWAYQSDAAKEMWGEMTQVLTPGVKQSIRLVVTYAGKEQDDPDSPLRKIYNMVVKEAKDGTNEFGGPPAEPVPELTHIRDDKGNPVCWRKGKIFVYWDHVSRMPWLTNSDYYEEQRSTLRPAKFLQLHKNMWTSGTETFVPIAWWDRAEKLEKKLKHDPQSPFRQHPLTIGVDVAYKQDSSAAVAVWHDPGSQEERQITGLADHKIWEPEGELEIHMEKEIVSWILELAANANVSRVVCDPSNFYGGIIELRNHGLDVVEFNQQGSKMVYASSNLYSILKNKVFVAYPAPDIRQHILHAVAESKGRGYRIKKESEGNKIDAAVALAMACFDIKENHGVDTSEDLVFESQFHDLRDEEYEDRKISEERAREGIPPQLRSHLTQEDLNRVWNEMEQEEAEPFRF